MSVPPPQSLVQYCNLLQHKVLPIALALALAFVSPSCIAQVRHVATCHPTAEPTAPNCFLLNPSALVLCVRLPLTCFPSFYCCCANRLLFFLQTGAWSRRRCRPFQSSGPWKHKQKKQKMKFPEMRFPQKLVPWDLRGLMGSRGPHMTP